MGRKNTDTSHYVDALRLPADELSAILGELDATRNNAVAAELRNHDRTTIAHTAGFIVRMFQPGGTVVNYLVKLRNISKTGVAFLHGSFVYEKTACTFLLKARSGQVREIAGRVVRCRHIRGNIHEVGLKFDEPIVLSEFIDDAKVQSEPAAPVISSAAPRFAGNVLYVSDNPDDRELLGFHLKRMGVKVASCSAPQAMEQYRASRCTLVLMDTWFTTSGSAQLAGQIRTMGYAGPIIGLCSGDPEADNAGAAFTQIVSKPITPERLTEWLSEHLPQATSGGDAPAEAKPLLSAFWDDALMRPLIVTFLSRLESRVRELDKLLHSENRPALHRQSAELRGTASGYGFPQIADAAAELVELAAGDATVGQLRQKLDTLTQHCRAACAVVRRAQSA